MIEIGGGDAPRVIVNDKIGCRTEPAIAVSETQRDGSVVIVRKERVEIPVVVEVSKRKTVLELVGPLNVHGIGELQIRARRRKQARHGEQQEHRSSDQRDSFHFLTPQKV